MMVVLSRKESQHCLVVIILLLEVTITAIKGRYLDNVAGHGILLRILFPSADSASAFRSAPS